MNGGDKLNKYNAQKSWREVLFSDVLQLVRFRTSHYFRGELGAPWGLGVADHGAVFHIIVEGKCWLQLKGIPRPVELSAGDFVLLPRGDVHSVCDSPASPIVDFFDAIKRNPPDDRRVFRAGGGGATTKLVCGIIQFENTSTDPLLTLLPPLIHMRWMNGEKAARIRATFTQILRELDSYRAGTQTLVTRFADILFIEAVRTYFDGDLAAAERGWLAATRDPQVGRALAVLHAHPLEPWTLVSLARRVATSRSLLAEKFTHLVGEPPLRYLKGLRLNAAAIRLRSTNDKLSAIAASAGYDSAAAFTKAFKKRVGKTPGEYRRSG
jgi:AraC-like DNA-binding protein